MELVWDVLIYHLAKTSRQHMAARVAQGTPEQLALKQARTPLMLHRHQRDHRDGAGDTANIHV